MNPERWHEAVYRAHCIVAYPAQSISRKWLRGSERERERNSK